MRIAFITPEYITEHNFDGGLANYLHRAAASLKNAGHDVEIFTASLINERIEYNGFLVHRVKWSFFGVKLFKKIFRNKINTFIEIIARSYYLKKRFITEHKKNNFDIVQAASFWATGLFISRIKNIALITRISSFEPLWRGLSGIHCSLDNALSEWIELVQMKNSRAVYAPSQRISKLVAEYEPLKTDVVYPPFIPPKTVTDDTAYTKFLLNKDYLLFFGTLCRMKGIELIFESLPRIFDENSNINFVFVGKGSPPIESKELQPYKSRIFHLEPLHHEKLFPIIVNARAVVLPSIIDNIPNACIESMYLEKVVVGTYGASFDEIIVNGESGYLFDYYNKAAFCTIISNICRSDKAFLNAIGRNAKERVTELFDFNHRIDDLVSYFNAVIKNKK